MSAAFDTVHHTILQQCLQTSFGLSDVVLSWFHLYLDQRQQNDSHRGEFSAPPAEQFGCLRDPYWAQFCLCCIRPRRNSHRACGQSVHQYAHDMQVYGRCHPNDATSLSHELDECQLSSA